MNFPILMPVLLLTLLAVGSCPATVSIVNAQGSNQPIVISHPLPGYPAIAIVKKELGKVLIDVKIDPAGKVVSSSVVEGPPMLSRVAREKALEWRFNDVPNGTELRPARLTFIFHPHWRPVFSNQPRFTPPYRVDIISTPTFDCFGKCRKKKFSRRTRRHNKA